MSPELLVLCGIPGSGKSTWCRATLPEYVVVSKDLMPNARRKEARQQRLIREALLAGRSVVVDNTNLTRAARAPIVALAQELGAPCRALVFAVRIDEALARNAGRSGRARVPDGIVLRMAATWEAPTLAEGFMDVEPVPSG